MSTSLVDVANLTVSYGRGEDPAVRGVNFQLGREKLGIVGESGSGKSTIGRALIRLLPPSAHVAADRLSLGDLNLLTADDRQMQRIRGRKIGLILQDPSYSLNPVVRVGDQIIEAYRQHFPADGGAKLARQKMLEMLQAVQIREPERVSRLYPHEISGGMGQRIMIAMMLIADPEVLIADEPTSALDVTVRLEVLSLLDGLRARLNIGLILISHDLNLVRSFCDRVLIMYAGQVVEVLDGADMMAAKHPYTCGLLRSLPSIKSPTRRLPTLVRDPAWAQVRADD